MHGGLRTARTAWDYTNPSTPYTVSQLVSTSTTFKQSSFHFSARCQQDMRIAKCVEAFAGMDIQTQIFSAFNTSSNSTYATTPSVPNTLSTDNYVSTIPGGYNIGIGANIGIRFRIVKSLYIGGAIGGAILLQSIGGEVSTSNYDVYTSNSTSTNQYNYTYQSSNWNSGTSFSLSLIYIH